MDENGSYRWPGNQPKKPTPKLNLSKITRVFTIIAVVRKMFDGSDKMQTTLGAILGSSFKSIIVILSLNIAMVAVLNVSNVLMQQVSYVFNSGSSLTEAKEIDFTEDQFATMGRVLNTIGNYSLNPSYNSRYNLNSCFNAIRSDMLALQQQGVFDFYYITKDENGEEIETWQSALQSLVFVANLKEELKMDVYNESVSNANDSKNSGSNKSGSSKNCR